MAGVKWVGIKKIKFLNMPNFSFVMFKRCLQQKNLFSMLHCKLFNQNDKRVDIGFDLIK